jgi:hypothetical protein
MIIFLAIVSIVVSLIIFREMRNMMGDDSSFYFLLMFVPGINLMILSILFLHENRNNLNEVVDTILFIKEKR